MPSGYAIILVLKIATLAVTVLFLFSLLALARGNFRLHGRINKLFFTLTIAAVILFEVLIRLGPFIEDGWSVTRGWSEEQLIALRVHLCFVIPLVVVLPVMLYTGVRHRAKPHVALSILFLILWAGMLTTGVFFLPHAP